MKTKHQRMIFLSVGAAFIGLALYLILTAFEDTLVFFYTPQQMIAKKIPLHTKVRLGGMVQKGSVEKKGLKVKFKVTDFEETFSVQYEGFLPDLFREGQGVVMEGKLIRPKVFQANTVLAKHDETYMPPEVAKSLKEMHGDDK